jgi:hypothetical protein
MRLLPPSATALLVTLAVALATRTVRAQDAGAPTETPLPPLPQTAAPPAVAPAAIPPPPAPAPAPAPVPAAPPATPTPAAPSAPAATPAKPLDVLEPPDLSANWMTATNRQPGSLLTAGPVTFSVYVDGYYAWQFSQPVDHTIFPTTVAPRHDEISLNLASVGVDVTGLDGPIGRVYLQYGSNTLTDGGQDATTQRGYFLSSSAFAPIQQAGVGWHFHALHGINTEIGIFPSYVGGDSYLPQENWNYTHPFMAEFTPYYFAGSRTQIFLKPRLKVEVWLVNGWQTYGEWHEAKAGGYLLQGRPSDDLVLSHNTYVGQDQPADSTSVRLYSDNEAQWQYFKRERGLLRSLALVAVADIGYETHKDAPDDVMTGGELMSRAQLGAEWAFTVRGDVFYDKTQSIIYPLPLGSPYTLPDKSAFLGGGLTTTLDFSPSPWIVFRGEYVHRAANIPYFSGHGGITGPGVASPIPGAATTFTPDLRKDDDRVIFNATLRL